MIKPCASHSHGVGVHSNGDNYMLTLRQTNRTTHRITSVYTAIEKRRWYGVKRAARGKIHTAIQVSTTPKEAAWYFLNRPYKLTGTSKKVKLGEGLGYSTVVMYGSMASQSGINLCKNSTPECRKGCLGLSSGHLSFHQQTMALKMWCFYFYPELSKAKLLQELRNHKEDSDRKGYNALARLNGSTDIDFTRLFDGQDTSKLPKQYDYTKDYERACRQIFSDYHLTYSISEDPESWDKAIALVKNGGTAAFVTERNKEKAKAFSAKIAKWTGLKVVDGDRHDLRFLDRGSLVCLTAKGDLKHSSPFVWTEEKLKLA